jgi:hypothetical protein
MHAIATKRVRKEKIDRYDQEAFEAHKGAKMGSSTRRSDNVHLGSLRLTEIQATPEPKGRTV